MLKLSFVAKFSVIDVFVISHVISVVNINMLSFQGFVTFT